MVKRKRVWRTRKRGSSRQRGKKFQIVERGKKKSKLPKVGFGRKSEPIYGRDAMYGWVQLYHGRWFGFVQGELYPRPATEGYSSELEAERALLKKFPKMPHANGGYWKSKKRKSKLTKKIIIPNRPKKNTRRIETFILENGKLKKKVRYVPYPQGHPSFRHRRKTIQERYLKPWERSRLKEIRQW